MTLTLVTPPASEYEELGLSLGEPEQLGEDDGEWSVSIYARQHRPVVTFLYVSEDAAKSARKALSATLMDVVHGGSGSI
jgi:hypothetical protein